jgi:hypothetical protein
MISATQSHHPGGLCIDIIIVKLTPAAELLNKVMPVLKKHQVILSFDSWHTQKSDKKAVGLVPVQQFTAFKPLAHRPKPMLAKP